MTKKEKPKTTVGIPPAEIKPLYQLAEALGFKRAGGGNLTAMLKYVMQMVQLFGPRIVAAALQPERLVEVAEGMQKGDSNNDEQQQK